MRKLEQIREESKEIKDKIDDTEERLRQLKNQEKKILKQDIAKRRKERTHRLITREAFLRKPYRKCRRTDRWRNKNPTRKSNKDKRI